MTETNDSGYLAAHTELVRRIAGWDRGRRADHAYRRAEAKKKKRRTGKASVPLNLWVRRALLTSAGVFLLHTQHVLAETAVSLAVGVAVAELGAYGIWTWTHRTPKAEPEGLVPTAEERALLQRLAAGYWTANVGSEDKPMSRAGKRGLDDVVPGRAELTDAGIVCAVRLDMGWTAKRLRAEADHVRALLGMRTGTRMQITAGESGNWARITIRTRSASDGMSMTWTPETTGIGVDTETGEIVTVDPYQRILVAGESGAGKSVALRPMLADVVRDPLSALVMFDLKQVEGGLWEHCARVAFEPDEVGPLASDLVTEMRERQRLARAAGTATWKPTVDRPRMVVLVDEGAEVKLLAKAAMDDLGSLARLARASEIHLHWATQKPTMSGQSAGIDPQIAAQLGVQLCLKVATATEVRTVLGEDATEKGWHANELPKPGHVLIRGTGRGPVPVRVWFMSDAQVKALPKRSPWSRAVEPDIEKRLHLVKEPVTTKFVSEGSAGHAVACEKTRSNEPEPDRNPAVSPVETTPNTVADDVLAVLRAAGGPVTSKHIVEQTGRSKGAVSKAIGRLAESGRVHRLADNKVVAA